MTLTPKRQPATDTKKRRISPVDVRVGMALRTRRMAMGLTLDELAQAAGLTAQQIHKYEMAQNRIPAARLNTLSQVLRMPIAEFFDASRGGLAFAESDDIQYEVMRILRSVQHPGNRQKLLRVLKVLAVELSKD